MRQHTEAEERKWNRWRDKQVVKPSGKPFKYGGKIGTVARVGDHEYTPQLAFTILEDGSQVECFRCELYVPPNDEWTAVYRGMLRDGVDPGALRHMVSKHISALVALPESFDVDHARQALGNFESELAKRIQQEAEGCVLLQGDTW
jgi:hypothetical protein